MKILIVDDEKDIADLIDVILKNEGFSTIKCYDPETALQEVEQNDDIDLALLDVMMPKIDGFSLCAKIRVDHTYPIIMLTARGEDVDKITGLTIGADDYVTKPFNPLELLARIKAQLRRATAFSSQKNGTLVLGALSINREEHTVQLFDETVSLTPTEFEILWMLCENAGRVVSSETIFETVWKEDYLDSNNTVMVHIRRIREKLHEPPRNPKIIKTVWGVGYKIEK
ncbi:MAG: response regulator transcription factor [Clostridia bacterium]|nr:response regulator transcription factor [Clostridia bacterium]MBR3593636.1 response regulator transcription factor [Clostridia bacterium]